MPVDSPRSRPFTIVRRRRFLALAVALLAAAALSPGLSAAPPAISFTAWKIVDYNGYGIPLWEAAARDANKDGDVDFMGIHHGYGYTQLFVENESTEWGTHADGTPKLVQSTQDFNRHSPKFWDANGDGYYGYVVADGDFGLAYRDRTASGLDPAGEQQVQVQWCASCNWDGSPRYGELSHLDVGDINGDGASDVVVVGDRNNPKIRVFFNQGGALVAGPIVGTYAGDSIDVKLADLDGDGDLDIVLLKRTESDGWPAAPMFYINNGNGTSFTAFDAPTHFQGRSLAVADANGDGKPDIFVSADAETAADGTYLAGSTPGIWLLTNNGNMSFSLSKVYSTDVHHYLTAMDAGDLNGDGFADIAFAVSDGVNVYSATPQAYAGDGAGNFTLAWTPDPNHTWTVDTLSIIKYNGHPAIVTAGYNGNSYLYANFATDSTPPVVNYSLNGTLGANGWYTSNVTLTWSVTDPDSPVTSKVGCVDTTVTTDTAGTTYSCSATSAGGTSPTVSVTIKRDTTPPTITSVTANPSVLWPPDHTMRPVTVSVDASDATSGGTVCRVSTATVNEGTNQFEPDIQITGDASLNLRAERDGSGSGRVYGVQVSCQDAAGNVATGQTPVLVPHDQGRSK